MGDDERRAGLGIGDPSEESFSRIVAPILAGFTVPAIVTLATAPISNRVANDAALSCLIASTGLFLASFQLSIGSLYERYRDQWSDLRAGLSFAGIALLIAGLAVLVGAVTSHWWVAIPLAVLCAGALAPILLRGWVRRRRPPTADR